MYCDRCSTSERKNPGRRSAYGSQIANPTSAAAPATTSPMIAARHAFADTRVDRRRRHQRQRMKAALYLKPTAIPSPAPASA